jgi:molecular chaperone GrpE
VNDEKVKETTPEVEKEQEVMANGVEGETAVSDTTPAEPTCEELLAAAQEEAAKNLDGWMRSQAEFANARKRMEKQRVEIQVRAATDMVTRLLPVIDDFERAFDNVPDIIHEDSWFAGIELVNRKLANVLESFNVETIQSVGQMFDPHLHEAIMQEPSDEHESGIVIKELQKGYKMGDRVIRPSLVNVAA